MSCNRMQKEDKAKIVADLLSSKFIQETLVPIALEYQNNIYLELLEEELPNNSKNVEKEPRDFP